MKSRMAIGIALMLALTMALTGCGGGRPQEQAGQRETITAVGSTALLPLVQAAKDEFESSNPNVTVNVSGGGSFTGLTQVANGAAQIGNSDVDVTPELKDKGLVDHKVAVAPFLIIVNPSVTVSSLTQEQLIGIFTGQIKDWSEVGGAAGKITIIHRPASSGSRATIKEVVLQGREFDPSAVTQDSNGKVFDGIKSTPGSIGYIDAAYLKEGVKALAYNGVPYSPDAVVSGQYPVYAYEHMFTKGEATGATKAFIDFILSPDFQNAFVEKQGFIPVSKMSK
ncbi:MAG: phosphate ABC transporter substrate-binding protein [Bacillota bacterium]